MFQKVFLYIYKISGLKVSNHTLPFGKLVDVVKILGVYLSLNVDIKEEMNYKEILSKIKTN